MVYPNEVIANQNWIDSSGIGILLALGENDGMYIYNTAPTNYLHLGMPQEVVGCEVRVRADDSAREFPILQLEFYLDNNLVDVVYLDTIDDWITYTLTVDRWSSVVLIVSGEDFAGVDFLRAYPFGGLPTRRTLTGVGV
jgi:hypothetical protein